MPEQTGLVAADKVGIKINQQEGGPPLLTGDLVRSHYDNPVIAKGFHIRFAYKHFGSAIALICHNYTSSNRTTLKIMFTEID